jgi:hypothetical protein
LLLLHAVSAFAQGLYWESTTTTPSGQRTERHAYLPRMFKTVTDAGETVIVRLDKDMLYTLDPQKQTYSEMSFAELERTLQQASGQMDAAMAQMQKELAGMPPEQRQMVEQMMRERMPGMHASTVPAEVTKTNETRQINGYACTKYVIRRGQETLMTLWTTNDIKDFSAMRKDFDEFAKHLAAVRRMDGDLGQSMRQVEGFPIQTETGQGRKTLVTKVEKRAITASEFDIPAGYKKAPTQLR